MSPPSERSKRATDDARGKLDFIETVTLDDRCTPLMMRVAATLSAMANAEREAWPGYDALCFITGAARQNVITAVEKLFQLGYISAIDKDEKAGRSRGNRYTLRTVPVSNPAWCLYRDWERHIRDEELSRAHDRSAVRGRGRYDREKLSRDRAKLSSLQARTVMLACPEPSGTLSGEPSSDTTVSDAAYAASQKWKGSTGTPLPAGFPDEQAMEWAATYVSMDGLELDLSKVRRAFRSHHYSVRCLLSDWQQSWARWVESAIDAAEAAA